MPDLAHDLQLKGSLERDIAPADQLQRVLCRGTRKAAFV
jgi:hypothetical protein